MAIHPLYRGYRFLAEIIAHCRWLHFRFCLSFRDVQEMMLELGVEVSHERTRLHDCRAFWRCCSSLQGTALPRRRA